MITHSLVASFRSAIEKDAAVPPEVFTSGLGMLVGGGLTAKSMIKDIKKDNLLRDLDAMPEHIYKKRMRTRVASLLGGTALGGVVGAGVPTAASASKRFVMRHLKSSLNELKDPVSRLSREAGNAFMDAAAERGVKKAPEVADEVVKHIYTRATDPAVSNVLHEKLRDAGREAAQGAASGFGGYIRSKLPWSK
jgi:hypothetical protein